MERLHRPLALGKVRRASGKNKKSVGDEIYWHKKIKSPIGWLDLVASDKALLIVQMEDHSHDHLESLTLKKGDDHQVLKATDKQLKEYFDGTRKTFDLPLEFKGTEFQKQAWEELLSIPYGKCTTYGVQAAQIGRPKAFRAVGACNGRNPISIIVPCHRVISASGTLIGYAGGLSIKRYLLELEGIQF
jgi:methylated-DNA-[protein]-cysteine S-methyltransferase